MSYSNKKHHPIERRETDNELIVIFLTARVRLRKGQGTHGYGEF